ncbi:F-box only protein 4 [Trichomycterus rosablanca]|uniref:F-box only protein 4 n=1 Tax=Trichomycterus rosablanca TaxID=2290929 RepID=UPI002F35572A
MSLLTRIRSLFTDTNRIRTEDSQTDQQSLLNHLPVDLQFLIMTFLPPEDLCRLGGTARYWRSMVRDPLLWRYFLIRDAPRWTSVDHLSTPRGEFLSESVGDEMETERGMLDYMAEYLRCSPACRFRQPRPPPSALSFLSGFLVPETEPRFAMFGAGLEQLDESLVTVMMNSPHVLGLGGIPQRQINGIGSGISFIYGGQHKFNIITLYSTNRAERERARVDRSAVSSKIFIQEDDDGSGRPRISVAPQIQEVIRAVNGFIYVVNAEQEAVKVREDEWTQIIAVLQPDFGSTSRPLLVLSCISREEENQRTSPSVSVAHQLQLHLLPNPWMVQDVVAASLSGLTDGMDWLLRHSGVRL